MKDSTKRIKTGIEEVKASMEEIYSVMIKVEALPKEKVSGEEKKEVVEKEWGFL